MDTAIIVIKFFTHHAEGAFAGDGEVMDIDAVLAACDAVFAHQLHGNGIAAGVIDAAAAFIFYRCIIQSQRSAVPGDGSVPKAFHSRVFRAAGQFPPFDLDLQGIAGSINAVEIFLTGKAQLRFFLQICFLCRALVVGAVPDGDLPVMLGVNGYIIGNTAAAAGGGDSAAGDEDAVRAIDTVPDCSGGGDRAAGDDDGVSAPDAHVG